MKINKKIISIMLATALTFSMVSCNASTAKKTHTDPVSTVTEEDAHMQTKVLHKINVTATDKIFIENGLSDYKIVIASDASPRTAASAGLINKHLYEAAGCSLDIIKNESFTYSDSAKWIVLGDTKLFDAAGLKMPSDDIGKMGYYIVTKDNCVFIAAKSDFGLQNGALEFLHHAVGYEMYSEDIVLYTNSAIIKLPNFNIIDRPDFDYRLQGNTVSSAAITGMRFASSGDIFIPVNGALWHNSFEFLNPDKYTNHPEWFATDKSQLCYTARGNAEYFDAMLTEFMKKLISSIDSCSNGNTITITIQDNHSACSCEACVAERNKYNTDSAVIVKFCNQVSIRLEKYLKQQAEKTKLAPREIDILFFAYNKTTPPPTKKVDGRFEPIDDSVICRDNVGVYLAPIEAAYNKSFYDPINEQTADIVKGWSALSNKLYMWLYETNYAHYLYPLNSYDTTAETYRFCKENNAIFMFNEGQYNQGNVTCFGKLKEYFNSKFEWNVNSDYNAVVDDFFANYFLEAATPMRTYFDELQAHLRYIEAVYPGDVNGNIYNNMAQAKLWQKKTLDHWEDLINEAYAAIEPYKITNSKLYDILVKHIKLESIFIRFAKITLYNGMYSDNTLLEMRKSFKEDCGTLSITMLNEPTSLESLFTSWGI